VGPTLASLANHLLLSYYGPCFSVRVDTQETVKSTGAQKQTFDVIVFDSESDTSKSVSGMSGGEKIWINEALTRDRPIPRAVLGPHLPHTIQR
jgi:exonuclease SbcC